VWGRCVKGGRNKSGVVLGVCLFIQAGRAGVVDRWTGVIYTGGRSVFCTGLGQSSIAQ
jgi:hypothetical protein